MRSLKHLLVWALGSSTLLAQNPLFIPDTLSGSNIKLTLQQGSHAFKAGRKTTTMGANGNLLGPTIFLQQKKQVRIDVTNKLGEETTIHWHGLHVAPWNDGGPHIVIPNQSTWSPAFEVLDRASTHWYHPHLHEKTNEHVQKGIAGLIIVRDEEEAALTLPRSYGIDDFPLILQSKCLDTGNQIITHTALDSIFMINGTIRPTLDLPAQVVRLRLLNGASERYFNVGLSGNKSFQMIGSDGGLLSAPVTLTRLMLAPGERAELLVDLSGLEGQTIFLKNFGSELANAIYGARQPGMGAGQTIPGYSSNPLNGSDFNMLTVKVGSRTAKPVVSIPASLVKHVKWDAAKAQATRSLTFSPMMMGPTAIQGPFLINGAHFNMNVINYRVPFENIEIWELRNQTPIGHPFHIHNVPFYILDINGVAPPAQLQGLKDVVHVPGGNGIVRFITKFTDHYSDSFPYMYHCHILTHEDGGMMGQFLVVSPCKTNLAQPRDTIASIGANVQFAVSSSDTGFSYQWQTDAGFGFQNLSNAGQYQGVQTATLRVSNVGAQNHNQFFRCILKRDSCTFTSEAAVLNISSMGVAHPAHTSIRVWPNPAEEMLHVALPAEARARHVYQLFSSDGKLLRNGILEQQHSRISVQQLAPGSYILRLPETGHQALFTVGNR